MTTYGRNLAFLMAYYNREGTLSAQARTDMLNASASPNLNLDNVAEKLRPYENHLAFGHTANGRYSGLTPEAHLYSLELAALLLIPTDPSNRHAIGNAPANFYTKTVAMNIKLAEARDAVQPGFLSRVQNSFQIPLRDGAAAGLVGLALGAATTAAIPLTLGAAAVAGASAALNSAAEQIFQGPQPSQPYITEDLVSLFPHHFTSTEDLPRGAYTPAGYTQLQIAHARNELLGRQSLNIHLYGSVSSNERNNTRLLRELGRETERNSRAIQDQMEAVQTQIEAVLQQGEISEERRRELHLLLRAIQEQTATIAETQIAQGEQLEGIAEGLAAMQQAAQEEIERRRRAEGVEAEERHQAEQRQHAEQRREAASVTCRNLEEIGRAYDSPFLEKVGKFGNACITLERSLMSTISTVNNFRNGMSLAVQDGIPGLSTVTGVFSALAGPVGIATACLSLFSMISGDGNEDGLGEALRGLSTQIEDFRTEMRDILRDIEQRNETRFLLTMDLIVNVQAVIEGRLDRLERSQEEGFHRAQRSLSRIEAYVRHISDQPMSIAIRRAERAPLEELRSVGEFTATISDWLLSTALLAENTGVESVPALGAPGAQRTWIGVLRRHAFTGPAPSLGKLGFYRSLLENVGAAASGTVAVRSLPLSWSPISRPCFSISTSLPQNSSHSASSSSSSSASSSSSSNAPPSSSRGAPSSSSGTQFEPDLPLVSVFEWLPVLEAYRRIIGRGLQSIERGNFDVRQAYLNEFTSLYNILDKNIFFMNQLKQPDFFKRILESMFDNIIAAQQALFCFVTDCFTAQNNAAFFEYGEKMRDTLSGHTHKNMSNYRLNLIESLDDTLDYLNKLKLDGNKEQPYCESAIKNSLPELAAIQVGSLGKPNYVPFHEFKSFFWQDFHLVEFLNWPIILLGLNYSVIDIDIRAYFFREYFTHNSPCGKAEIVAHPHPTNNSFFSGKKDSWLLASVPITTRVLEPITARALEDREIMIRARFGDYNLVVTQISDIFRGHSRLWFQFSSDVVRNIVDFIRVALNALLTKHREKLFQNLERELPVLLDNLERCYLELSAFLKFILPDFDSVAFLRPVAHLRDSFDRARQHFSLENLKALLDLCLLQRNSVLGEANARIYPGSLSNRETLAQKMGPHEKSFMQMVYLTKCILSSCGSSYYNYTPMLKPSDFLSHIGNTFGYIDAKKRDEAKDAIKGYKMYFIDRFQTVIKNQRIVERNPVTLGLQGAKSELSEYSAALLTVQQQSRREGAPFGPSAFFQGAPSTSTSPPSSESGAAPQL